MARALAPILAGLAAVAVAFIAAEILLARAGIPATIDHEEVTEADPLLLWRNRSGFSGQLFRDRALVTTGPQGFRGGPVSPAKKPGTRRVIVIGDSATFGVNVADQDTYPAMLERMLNDGSEKHKWEVVNGGVIGYTSWQGLEMFQKRVLAYSPDCVIISYAMNDGTPNWSGIPLRRMNRAGALTAFTRNQAFQHSRVFRLLLLKAAHWRVVAAHRRKGRSPQTDSPSVPPDEYRNNLVSMARLARASGVRVLFFWVPVQLKGLNVDYTIYPYWIYNRQAAEKAVTDLKGKAEKARVEGKRELLSPYYFMIAKLEEYTGDPASAKEYYLKALLAAAGPNEPRFNSYKYRGIMKSVAREEGLRFVDAYGAFADSEMSGSPPDLFTDPYHPGKNGNRIIAGMLREEIAAEFARK